MKHLATLAWAAAIAALFAACSKDQSSTPDPIMPDPKNPDTLTAQEKLLVGDWQYDYYIDTMQSTVNPADCKVDKGTPICKADDIYHLKANKKYAKDEGNDTCLKNEFRDEQDWSADERGIAFPAESYPSIFENTSVILDKDHIMFRHAILNPKDRRVTIVYYKRKL